MYASATSSRKLIAIAAPMATRPAAKRTSSAATPQRSDANATRRARICSAASSAALPLRSLPVDAAVADVVDEHRAVAVDVNERAGLVEVDEIERDAELDGSERDAALEHFARCVELRDRRAARAVGARPLELADERLDDVVFDDL